MLTRIFFELPLIGSICLTINLFIACEQVHTICSIAIHYKLKHFMLLDCEELTKREISGNLG